MPSRGALGGGIVHQCIKDLYIESGNWSRQYE
jgi:hypothetical protein